MKIVATGLSGLAGSQLQRHIGGRCELAAVDLPAVDITDRDATLRAFEAHADAAAAIHLAAFTDVSAAWRERGDREGLCYRVNVLGTRNVAEACARMKLHLTHVSTDFVFDGASDDPYGEEDSPRPVEWYGETKLMAEDEARRAGRWTIARIAFPFCAEPAPRPDLVRRLLAQLRSGKTLRLFEDQSITPSWLEDVAGGLELLARERPAEEIFHLTGSSWISPYELGRMITDVWDLPADRIVASSLKEHLKQDPRPRQRSLKISNAKWRSFARSCGWPAPLTLRSALEKMRELEGAEEPSPEECDKGVEHERPCV